MIQEIKGNLIDLFLGGNFDMIAHQANCFHKFGTGIAKEIKQKIPRAYDGDLQTLWGDINKLGTYSLGYITRLLPPDANGVIKGKSGSVLNIYSQYITSTETRQTNYYALGTALTKINKLYGKDYSIGLPLIGCGVAGGDWKIVRQIIEETLNEMDVTIVHYG